jgi:hypothetical protein
MLFQFTTEVILTISFFLILGLIALFLYLIMNVISGSIRKEDLMLDAKVKKKKKDRFK